MAKRRPRMIRIERMAGGEIRWLCEPCQHQMPIQWTKSEKHPHDSDETLLRPRFALIKVRYTPMGTKKGGNSAYWNYRF